MRARLLFVLLGAPLAWAAHLSICYLIVTLDCETAWNGGAWALTSATIVAAVIAAGSGLLAWRDLRNSTFDARTSTDVFVRRVGLIGAPVFVATIVLTGIAPAFVARCA